MSKQARSRANQPIVPELSTEIGKELLRNAEEFNRLAPWAWMHDSMLTGLRHPVTNEVLLCSILGRMKTVFALIVYRHAMGHRWVLSTILEERMDDDCAWEQDGVKAEFVLKRDLTKEDRAFLQATGFAPSVKGSRSWPQFRSLVPGAYPWHVTQTEAETLIFALPRVAALSRLTRDHEDIWEGHCEGEIPFLPPGFDPATEELRSEQLVWEPTLPPPPPISENVRLDQQTLDEMLKLPQSDGFHLELDLTYSPIIVIAEPERPRFPKLALAVGRATGFVGGFHFCEAGDDDGAKGLGTVFRNTVRQLGNRPATIRVQRQRVAAMLGKLATDLGFAIVVEEELEELNAAKGAMEAHLGRR